MNWFWWSVLVFGVLMFAPVWAVLVIGCAHWAAPGRNVTGMVARVLQYAALGQGIILMTWAAASWWEVLCK